ncbi:MAG: arylsulfatase [Puniceicoccaceae bacterium]
MIIVITDDQGYGDLSTHGNPYINTPNLDKLASQSVRLEDYHVSPYCVPSRAALLTGRYANRTGVHNVLEPHWFVRTNEVLMSTTFKEAGYATGMFGKWHLGDNYPFGPEHRDFDEVLRHYGGAIGVLADYWDNCYVDDTYLKNGEPIQVNGYCTDVFFNAARQFIDNAIEQEKPFFVYLPTNAPHGPRICPPSYAKPYDQGKTKSLATFYGMIANIDENVGKLRSYLEEKELHRNTLFIFTTDNGTAGGQRLYNAGMRGNKGKFYDGGHRVPFFLHWPAGGFDTERRINTLTSHMDVFPTLIDLCGLEQPARVKFDGMSLRPLLEQGDHENWPSRIIMTDSHQREPPRKWATSAVMTQRWRLIEGMELYDIIADPGQEQDIAANHPEVVTRLRSFYEGLWEEMEPTFDDVARIPLGDPATASVALNYHDCIGRHMFWFQNGIRSLTGDIPDEAIDLIDDATSERPLAFWPVEIVTDGEYEIELRRWPKEAATPIRAGLPEGDTVYGLPSHRTTPGKGFPATEGRLFIGEQILVAEVEPNAEGIKFKVNLKAGNQHLSARFIDPEGRSLDAFYVYVTKSE